MESATVFTDTAIFTYTILSALLMFLSSIYASINTKIKFHIWMIFFGIMAEFFALWCNARCIVMYQHSQNIEIWLFAELMLGFISMLLLALAASKILINKIPSIYTIFGMVIIGALVAFYFIYVIKDGNMVTNMRQIFRLSGYTYVSICLLNLMHKQHNTGFILAGVVTSVLAVLSLISLWNGEYLLSFNAYFPILTFVLLSVSLFIIKNDIYAQRLMDAEQEIEKYNQRIEEIIKLSPFPIIISRLSDDRILLANNNAIKLLGIRIDELERYRLRDFFADIDNRQLLNARLEQEKEVQDFEVLVKTPTGTTPFWLLASVNVIDYNYDLALYSAFQDITTRKNRETMLKNQAIRDPLTSLYNRRYFEDEVYKRIVDSKVTLNNFSILMIDIDHFKKVNDTYGHKIGDKVLIELASTCEKALREVDIVARYGGEEFIIYLDGVNSQKAKTVADRLRETLSRAVVYSDEGEEVRFTVSIGVSSCEISDNIDTLIKTADEALYHAKATGRNKVEIFNQDTNVNYDSILTHERIKNNTDNVHPIFAREENEEISLLDGIEAKNIETDNASIEEKQQIISDNQN